MIQVKYEVQDYPEDPGVKTMKEQHEDHLEHMMGQIKSGKLRNQLDWDTWRNHVLDR